MYATQKGIHEILDTIVILFFFFLSFFILFYFIFLHNCECGRAIHKGLLTIKQPAKKINDFFPIQNK